MAARTPQKIGLVTIQAESGWRSCVSISANLTKAYVALQKNHGIAVQQIQVSPKATSEALSLGSRYYFDLAREILRGRITDLVFIDHHIDAMPILYALRELDPQIFKKLRYTFHIYGDFTLTTHRWIAVGKLLAGLKVKYVCASERQCRLVSFFLADDQSECALCPFPIDDQVYAYSTRVRQKVRRRLGFEEDQTVLLYTGRMSLQKGIIALLDQFERLQPVANNYALVLAGPFDDLGGMTSGVRLPCGFFFHHVNARMEQLPEAVRQRIKFIGDLGVEDLKEIYSAADLFVSLSLHHDEDYGMCPAEALATGLPSILSDWAGYASFAQPGVPCQLIPVAMEKRGLTMDLEYTFATLAKVARSRSSAAQRKRDGATFVQRFGIAGVAKILRELLKPESFARGSEFSWAIDLVLQSGHTLKGDFYREVYENYVRPTAH